MRSLNFIGGEKGGVGKSLTARVLAQYFIDKGRPFTGFDTDRSHTSFTRFYADQASHIIVDKYEGLDLIANVFEEGPTHDANKSVIVDLAAQTALPLARWIKDSDVLPTLAEMGVTVNFWHLADAGKDSVDLLDKLLNTFGPGPNYILVKNMGRGADFSELEESPAMKKTLALGGQVITLGQLHEGSLRKIDSQNVSFWAAINNPGLLGILERQRVKVWLRKTYETFDRLPL
jgi:hypothetical protein